MSNKSRLNPNKASRATLRDLQERCILRRELVGIRHAVRASTGAVDRIGFDVDALHGQIRENAAFPNFYPGVRTVSEVITYNGGRAEITATAGWTGYEGHPLDLSSHFCENVAALNLLKQTSSGSASYYDNVRVYGDAVLVNHRRMHWKLPTPAGLTCDDMIDLNNLLRTPRDILPGSWRGPTFFFHEEPSQDDLIFLKMRLL